MSLYIHFACFLNFIQTELSLMYIFMLVSFAQYTDVWICPYLLQVGIFDYFMAV